MKSLLVFFFCVIYFLGFSQPSAPCGNDYGSTSDESAISFQMRYGTISDAINAINTAKNTRGTSLGCSQTALTYSTPNITQPSLSNVVTVWNTNHVPVINAFSVTCPRIGRYENNDALGAYYASTAGYYSNLNELIEIGDMMYDQQYATWNIASPDVRNEGVYGYLSTNSGNSCYLSGIVGSSVTSLCSTLPVYCQTYSNGQFAGSTFAISGQDDANNWFDGGLAYDHGWVGAQFIEAAIQQTDPLLKQKYRNSLEKSTQFAINEYAVKNHNYTSKLIWLLAQMYAWTGDVTYKNELNYKLDKNLLPGILMDTNNDGFVDGTSPQIAFTSLTETAQTPGRMWDAHNSLPWYNAMNAWALTEAYVAFRDQGDLVRAAELKPYVVAMLDNLSNEILTKGLIPDQLGVRDLSYGILIGIWKIARYESESHANWENAAWALWNSGYFNTYSTHSVCVGLYLNLLSDTPFVPLADRENFVLNTTEIEQNEFSIYPNPVQETLTIASKNNTTIQKVVISTLDGKCALVLDTNEIQDKINLSALSAGTYFIQLDSDESSETLKFIKE